MTQGKTDFDEIASNQMIQPAGAVNDSPTTIPVGEGLSEAETLPDHIPTMISVGTG